MNAGRELDALVAEKVMEWSSVVVVDRRLLENVPHYSTEMAAAWEVVERLRSTRLTEIEDEGDNWRVWFRPFRLRDGYRALFDPTSSAGAKTAPLAICLAALKAVEAPAEVSRR